MSATNLKRDFRDRWIAALRSGTYPQGIGHLCVYGAYCCLGVGFVVDGVPGVPDADVSERYIDGALNFDGCTTALNDDRRERWGLNFFDETALMKMNDDRTPFVEIADHIETLPVEDA